MQNLQLQHCYWQLIKTKRKKYNFLKKCEMFIRIIVIRKFQNEKVLIFFPRKL